MYSAGETTIITTITTTTTTRTPMGLLASNNNNNVGYIMTSLVVVGRGKSILNAARRQRRGGNLPELIEVLRSACAHVPKTEDTPQGVGGGRRMPICDDRTAQLV